MQNTLQNLNHSLKALTRSLLISIISKKDTNKLEKDLYYVKREIQVSIWFRPFASHRTISMGLIQTFKKFKDRFKQ